MSGNRPPLRRLAPAALLALLLAACSPSTEEPEGANAPRAVKVVSVEMRPLNQGLIATGRLVPREEVAVSTQLAGYQVASVPVDQGATVQKGEVLAQLDTTLLDVDIAQRRAAVQQAKVAAEKARQEAERASRLKIAGSAAMSEEAINTRLLAAKTAQAALAQAQAALDGLTIRRDLMTIRAPVAGRVLSRTVRPGDISAPGTIMFRIASGGEVEVDAEIPERSMGLVVGGQKAEVTLQSGATVEGTVRLVSAELDRDTRLGRARVLLPVRDDLRPGGFANVVFASPEAPVRSVREGAVRYTADGATVMAVGDGDKVQTVGVKIGRRAEGYVELLDGPQPGTRVLVGAQGFVLDGDQVTPVDATAEATP
ncbi:MAG: efflux RND transporter periplasmic adaptor subunit [Alphaproteobacteria bacterium]|nr:efflux RND transporter periplasmic adaptor subunit [Alphaproteobacteria bacterium]